MEEDLSGQVVRGYELREKVGSGGFGAVYRAYQKGIDREVAIKIILPEFVTKPEFVQRFEAEARLIARLEHFHIVPLFDYWYEPGGNAYLVMRWLRGGSLRDLVDEGPLSFDLTVRLLRQTAEALTTAHRAGVIHRDIKPDNILLDEQQNAYLSDFGIAKDLVNTAHLTKTGTVGSPGYMSPEQFFGDQVSPQSDIYSLGMTLYECLCGTHPFPTNHMKHLRFPIPPPSARRPEIPPALDAVLLRATVKEPNARFTSVAELARAFEAALAAPPVRADEPVTTPSEAPAQQSKREPVDVSQLETIQMEGQTVSLSSSSGGAAGDVTALLLEADYDVPSRAHKLIGRNSLLADVQTLLDQDERVLLQGIGGIGKTALAAEVASTRLQAGKGPVLWLRVGSDDAAGLMLALTRALDPRVVMRSDANPQAIRKLLHARAVQMIVLDDARNDQTLRYMLDALPPRFPLLVTSRQRFPIGKMIDVGELERATALELLSYHAGQHFTADDADAAELCRTLGCHPFALEIAGKTLLVDELTPAEFLRRIADAPHLIETPGAFGEAGRTSIRDLLALSVNGLDEETRSVFFAFGALSAPQATPEMIALLVNRAADKELVTLGRRGLAKRTHPPGSEIAVYRLHDLAHSYARAATSIDRPHMIAACRTYAERHVQEVNHLDAERTNILKAAQAAQQSGDTASLLAIMRALTVDGPYLSARGYDALLIEQLDSAIETARTDNKALHFLLSKRANAYFDRNQLAAALADYREALALARQLDMRDRVVILLCVASKTPAHQGDTATAEAYLQEAEQIATAAGDDLLTSRVLENQGYYYGAIKGDLTAARDIFARQAEIGERLDNPGRLFFALSNLGAAYNELGQSDAARGPLERALQVARDADNQPWQAQALYILATMHHKQNQRDLAQQALDEALGLFRACGIVAKVAELTEFITANHYTITPDQRELY
jgi:serine/threonine protein kinase/tetratricopeptide (TPR) repeat protein